MDKTGFCWNCGRQCEELFCANKKCKQQWDRKQGRQIKVGKRAGYGVTGSTH